MLPVVTPLARPPRLAPWPRKSWPGGSGLSLLLASAFASERPGSARSLSNIAPTRTRPPAVTFAHRKIFSDATQFNPTDPDSHAAYGGGRFDSPGGDPPFLYAGSSIEAALSESLLRTLPFPPTGKRELARRKLEGRSISELALATSIWVVALHGEGLQHVGQDGWLTHCPGSSYPMTRLWGAQIRRWVPRAAGLEWRARHHDDEMSYVLYEGDVPPDALVEVQTYEVDTADGLAVISPALRRLNVAPPLL